jgi:hypothetical protein
MKVIFKTPRIFHIFKLNNLKVIYDYILNV